MPEYVNFTITIIKKICILWVYIFLKSDHLVNFYDFLVNNAIDVLSNLRKFTSFHYQYVDILIIVILYRIGKNFCIYDFIIFYNFFS